MKCDELKAEPMIINDDYTALFYPKDSVDAAIAELKEVYKDSVELKIKIWERCKKAEDELRMTQRALWIARAMRADDAAHWTVYVTYMHYHENSFYAFDGDDIFHRHNKNLDGFKLWCSKWETVKGKCLKKAEEYK